MGILGVSQQQMLPHNSFDAQGVSRHSTRRSEISIASRFVVAELRCDLLGSGNTNYDFF
jgi:hypothetical protein